MLRLSDRRHLLPGAAAFSAALLAALLGLNALAGEPAAPPRPGAVELQLLGVNDFHGHLEPPAPGIGGAAWLSAHLARAARSHPGRTITVHAGDMVGASPLVSSWFHDEPAIEATNRMGFDVGTVGNHEFDEGGAELLRLLRGGRRTDGPRAFTSDPGWQGASYPYTAANTVDRAGGRPLLPPYQVVERAGVRVGFIGVTTEDTAQWLLPEHRRSLSLHRHLRGREPLDARAATPGRGGDRGPGPLRRVPDGDRRGRRDHRRDRRDGRRRGRGGGRPHPL